MPTFTHGKDTAVLIGGYNAASSLRSTTYSAKADTADVTCYGAGDHAYIAGLVTTTIAHEGVYSGGTAEADAWLAALFAGTAESWTIFLGGDTFGNPGFAHPAIMTGWAVTDDLGDAVKFTVDGQGSGVGLDRVVSLRAVAQSTGTAAGTNHDAGAGSNGGWAAYLHVISGTVSAGTVTVEHSTDGATGWTALQTWTFAGTAANALGAIGAQYGEGSGTVRRYVRHNLTGLSGTVRFGVAFARR